MMPDSIRSNSSGDCSHLKFNYFNLLGVLCKATCSLCSSFLKIIVMYTAAQAGLHYSLVINMYSLTPFLTAAAFYFIFKERMNPIHIIGIIMLMVCIVITTKAPK
jgi:drug/metabolite transporter (DMT)-like permease